VVVLLAFAESKTANTTTLGLDFPTVWDQTPHRFGLLYYGLDWSTCMEFLSFTTIAFVRFRHGTLLLTLLWWFISHFTCRFSTFVPCQVTGLLVFILEPSDLFEDKAVRLYTHQNFAVCHGRKSTRITRIDGPPWHPNETRELGWCSCSSFA
jgi:hypothetical protein